MKQWVIDRYNKGQDKYEILNYNSIFDTITIETLGTAFYEDCNISLYNFLFNPEFGFAKAFWGEDTVWETNGYTQWNYGKKQYQYHLQQMAISDDPEKYLEQFKD
jgi:hypothetical protein